MESESTDFDVVHECEHYIVVQTPHAANTMVHDLLSGEWLGAVSQNGLAVLEDNKLFLYWNVSPEHLKESLQKAINACREWGTL